MPTFFQVFVLRVAISSNWANCQHKTKLRLPGVRLRAWESRRPKFHGRTSASLTTEHWRTPAQISADRPAIPAVKGRTRLLQSISFLTLWLNRIARIFFFKEIHWKPIQMWTNNTFLESTVNFLEVRWAKIPSNALDLVFDKNHQFRMVSRCQKQQYRRMFFKSA